MGGRSPEPGRWIVALLGGDPPPLAERRVAREVERLLVSHRIEGLAVATHRRLRSGSSPPILPSPLVERLEPAYRTTGMATALILESARRARRVLEEEGIESVLFKGAALVEAGVYSDPGARRMDDADLLVRRSDASRAVDALRGAGYRPLEPWDPSKPGWVDSATFHDSEAPPGLPISLDLHWRTGYGRLRFGGGQPGDSPPAHPDEGGLWRGAVEGIPRAEVHFALIAEHVLKHLRVRSHVPALGDLLRLASRIESWGEVEQEVARSPLAHGMRALLAGLREEAGLDAPDRSTGAWPDRGVSAELRPSRLVGRGAEPGSGRLVGLLLRWRLLGSPGAVLDDVLYTAFPGRRWLRARYGPGRPTPLLWLRYVTDALSWAFRGSASPASPNQERVEKPPRQG